MYTVLIVDDMASVLDLMSRYLADEGFNVIKAMDAEEALTVALSQKPDVIITDILMPGKSGYELCRSLKRNPSTKGLPVVFCTCKNQMIDRLWSMKQGVDLYVTKPFTREQLVEAVRSVTGYASLAG